MNKARNRSKLRRFFGKEYFILKRILVTLFSKLNYSKVNNHINFTNCIIRHKSITLRPLKNVDMALQHNKVINMQLAIKKINNVVLMPGEIFSIWKLIGRPTKAKGYLTGLTLVNGKMAQGIGGGLCQLGNLIYWMALHSPLTIKERWRHGYDVFPDINRKIPFACGATLSYNYIDLQIKNETNFKFQLKLSVDDEYLYGEIWCSDTIKLTYEVMETDHVFKHQPWGGYTRHNKIWKIIKSIEDQSEQKILISENAAIVMYNPLLENIKVEA